MPSRSPAAAAAAWEAGLAADAQQRSADGALSSSAPPLAPFPLTASLSLALPPALHTAAAALLAAQQSPPSDDAPEHIHIAALLRAVLTLPPLPPPPAALPPSAMPLASRLLLLAAALRALPADIESLPLRDDFLALVYQAEDVLLRENWGQGVAARAPHRASDAPRDAAVFGGQGSAWLPSLRQVYSENPFLRHAIDGIARDLRDEVSLPPHTHMWLLPHVVLTPRLPHRPSMRARRCACRFWRTRSTCPRG